MPDLDHETNLLLNLHARCKAFGVLPYAGGLLDQPADLMDDFDLIENARNKMAQKRLDDQKVKDAQEKLKAQQK